MVVLLKDEAYNQLLLLIEQGKLVHGTIYSLNTLAEELRMSKTPVRDAIQRLSDEKRIDVLPSRGIRLHEMSEEERMQHYHFSNAIEGYCLLELTKRRKNPECGKYIETMKYSVEQMKKCISEEVPFIEYFRYDQMFHQQILESLEDAYFSSQKYSIMGFYGRPEIQSGNETISRERIYQCHKKILECVLEGDAFGAYTALIEHSDLLVEP